MMFRCPAVYLAILVGNACAADFEIVSAPPTKDTDEVLVQGRVGETVGCLALTAEGRVCFVEGEAKDNRKLGNFGLRTVWHLVGAMYVDEMFLSIGEDGKLVGSRVHGKPYEQLYLYSKPPTKHVKIVIRDTDRRVDYTLKIAEESRPMDLPGGRSARVHDVFAIKGLDGAEFTFKGGSK